MSHCILHSWELRVTTASCLVHESFIIVYLIVEELICDGPKKAMRSWTNDSLTIITQEMMV